MRKINRGQLLTEFAIVIGAIAILSVVATFQYQKTQIRSKSAEARSILAQTAIALEAYRTDHGIFPYDGYIASGLGIPGYNYWRPPAMLSTPVAYVTSSDIQDPFRQGVNAPPGYLQFDNIRYTSTGSTWGDEWDSINGALGTSSFYSEILMEFGGYRLLSSGPDGLYGPTAWQGITNYPALTIPYDPTNGTMSTGDIIRTELSPIGYRNM